MTPADILTAVQPAVFLDRDNTLIANDGDLGDPEQVRLIEGVAQGLRALREAGYRLIVITNQGGVARGKYGEADVDAVHQRIAGLVDDAAGASDLIDRFYYCPYHPEATVPEYRRDHPWRKPHPGMILQAARDLRLDLNCSWLIGDQARDIAAGHAAGCRTILVSSGPPVTLQGARPTERSDSFADAVRLILNHDAQQDERAVTNVELRETTSGSGGDLRGRDVREATPDAAALHSELTQLRRAVAELAEEFRAERARRSDFTMLKMAAGVCQLLVLLLVLLGLLQLGQTDLFLKWMAGAGLAQLATMTILLADQRG